MWRPAKSSEALKQIALLMVRGGSPHLLPKLNEMHIYVHVLCLWLLTALSSLSLRVARGLRRESFSASANWATGILVETGNSVDYSLAIRLLSLRWLSLLHHEIAWLSVRLESVLCSKLPPPAHYPLIPHATSQPYHPSPYSPHLSEEKKRSSSGSPLVSEAVQEQDRLTGGTVLITSFPLTNALPPFSFSTAGTYFMMAIHSLWPLWLNCF